MSSSQENFSTATAGEWCEGHGGALAQTPEPAEQEHPGSSVGLAVHVAGELQGTGDAKKV